VRDSLESGSTSNLIFHDRSCNSALLFLP